MYNHRCEYSGDSTQLLYLRARQYAPGVGRFLTRDTWGGDYQSPLTLNAWNYTLSNPIRFSDPSGHCINPDGSITWWKWPWFNWGTCPITSSGPSITLTPTAMTIFTATATCTSTPTSTSTPVTILTPTSTPQAGDLSQDDIKILSLFIAAESSSGWVPDDISYMKAWALLNKHSYDLLIHKDRQWTPFESWKHHERGMISGTFAITDNSIEGQKRELLNWYAKALSGGWIYLKPARFAQIETVVRSAVRNWALNGSRSPADPIQGAIDFTDAGGLCFSDMGGGATCKNLGTKENPIWVYFKDMGITYETVSRDPVTLEEWRKRFWPNDSTYVYQVGIDPLHNNDPIYTFTRFKQPSNPAWPPLP